ncbi:MAG: helix-turn-helix domain-containing protein [Oscillospiraceae bacterium]|nr:helix-turn-helix domain-containing protein [Oscillospiraceae bacterium]
MISENLVFLRKQRKMSQEEVAGLIGVSRQTVAKWEAGETLPDISNCAALAKLYSVTVDELILYCEDSSGLPIPPKGKYFFGKLTVDGEGRITLPEKAMRVFGVSPGDELILLGDIDRGMALIGSEGFTKMAEMIRGEDKR